MRINKSSNNNGKQKIEPLALEDTKNNNFKDEVGFIKRNNKVKELNSNNTDIYNANSGITILVI